MNGPCGHLATDVLKTRFAHGVVIAVVHAQHLAVIIVQEKQVRPKGAGDRARVKVLF